MIRQLLATLCLGGAASLAMLSTGCQANLSAQPASATVRAEPATDLDQMPNHPEWRDIAAYTDDHGNYRPDWAAGINRPPHWPKYSPR